MRETTLMLSKVDILHAILDEKTWNIFNIIASSDSKSEILITRLKLTRKQYYSRMARLVQAGLAKRQKSRYLLTAFGKVIQNAEMNFEIRIEDALKNYWKLKAIDTLQMSSVMGEEGEKIISELIDNEEIKNVLMKVEESKVRTRSEVKKTHNVDQNKGLILPNYP